MKSLRKSVESFYLSILVVSLCAIVVVLFIVVDRLTLNQLDREIESFVTDLIQYLEEPSKEPVALLGKRDLGFLVTEKDKTIASFQMPKDLDSAIFDDGFHFFDGYRIFVKPYDSYRIVIAKSTRQRTRLLLTLGVSLLAALSTVILAAALFGKRLVDKLVKPIEDIGIQMDEVSKGLREKVEVSLNSNEVARLQDQINQALSRLKSTMDELRDFASYLSHQLRNPLASAKAQIELLMSSSINEHRQELEAVLKNLNRMVEITEGLLLLARIQHQREASFVEEDISTIFIESVEQVMRQFPQIEFELDLPTQVKLLCIKDLMSHVFVNLVENACKYSQGSDRVWIHLNKTGRKISFRVENLGQPVPIQEREKIFERFYRGSNKCNNGVGLGLAIVKAIVELHRGEVRYYYENGRNIFEVTFNVSSS